MNYQCNNCKSILSTSDIGLAYRTSTGQMIKETDYDFSDVKWIESGFNYCKKCKSEDITEARNN